MSLLTKDLIEKCKKYPLYSQDGKGGDATVIARFYIPKEFCRDGAFNWIITEGDVFYTDTAPILVNEDIETTLNEIEQANKEKNEEIER